MLLLEQKHTSTGLYASFDKVLSDHGDDDIIVFPELLFVCLLSLGSKGRAAIVYLLFVVYYRLRLVPH